MNYYELKLSIIPNTEINRDVLSALLADVGFESFVESERGLDTYISDKNYSEENIAEVLAHLPLPDTSIQYRIQEIPDQNWNETWEKHFFKPIIIDQQVVIHSSFHSDIPALPYDLTIDPKMAFGTGHHATTSLMVSYLLELDLTGKSCLDMGCGTAVLAILAKMKGAGIVTAIDNDEWAYANALENIRLNQTTDIQVQLGDSGLLGEQKYDFIFANINRNILLNDLPRYVQCMHPSASLFLSGFHKEDYEVMLEAGQEQGLKFVSYKEKTPWIAMHFVFIV